MLQLNRLNSREILFLLELIEKQYGAGYSDDVEGEIVVGLLQAKLSLMMEVAANLNL